MSNRDSMGFGDLLPQDVVDIFAQEKHGKRGQKKRSHSLGRALGWLKGKKRKDLDAKGQGLGLGPALDLALDGHPAGNQGGHKGGQKSGKQAHPQAVPKRHDDDKTPAPPLFQENVFIEGSRPQYLENLHTEALEGLKMMQQEETNNGVEFQDNESTISTMTVHTDGEGGGFMTDSTIADSSSVVSVQSSVSTRSSRSGLTRQESTFRPLNSGKKSENPKTKRRHRKTVAGIPRHVQKELGLDRAAWLLTQRFDEEHLHNGESDDNPTTSGGLQRAAESQTGAGADLQNTNAVLPLSKDQVQQLGTTSDDLDLLHRLEPDLSGEQRPRSLAVPWMTTANSLQPEPPSPVMSMSPQAAYMSKIIPNAVLPPSIEVVEISRGRSRNSVRTVSKSSLLVSSPSPSRASSRASSSRASNITSASRYNPINVSDNSCWSNSSESSETLVSDSSTISRSSTPRQRKSQDGDASAKEDKASVHSSNSKACTSNGKVVVKGGEVKKDGFARSLSVMKAKRAPPPPSRSYSLHNKMKRRSRDLAEVKVPGEENEKNKPGTIDSPGYNADTSSLDDSTGSASFSPIRAQQQAVKAEEAAKSEEAASKEKKKSLQESKRSGVVSPSSGYSSQDGASAKVSKQPHKRGILAKLQRLFPGSTHAPSSGPAVQQPEDLKTDTSVDTVSPSVRALRELFNIPPPPKVHAPPPPPPEVWAHSKRSFELLLGPPAPDNLQAIIKRNPKDRRQQRQSPSVSTESSVKSLVMERKHNNMAVTANGSLRETSKVQESGILSAESNRENNDRLAENVDLKGNSQVEKVRVSNLISEMLVRAAEKHEGRLEAVREEDKAKTTQTTEVKLPAISLVRMPPSPSPPLVHHPPQQTTTLAVSPESSWPPPPPPIAQVSLNGPDEVDLPLPPPPVFGELGIVVPFQAPPEGSIPGGDSSGPTPPVVSVVKREAEPQTPSALLNIPPPPPYTAPPPPVKTVSPPTIIVVSPPSPKEIPPPPSKEVYPPPPKEISPPPPEEVFPPPPTEIPPTPPLLHLKQIFPVRPKESSPPLVTVVSPSPVKEVSPPLVMEVSTLSAEEVSVSACRSSEAVTPVSSLIPPQSIPPPPPLPSRPKSSEQVDPPQESIPEPQKADVPANQEPSSQPSEVSIPPALEKAQDAAPSPPVNIPSPPPLPVHIKPQPSPAGTEKQTVELTSTPDVQEELTPVVTPSLLQMVKLRSVNSSPEPPKDQEPPETEVTMRKQPSNVVLTSSASSEAPQKPVRRSLVVISPKSPPSTSPPATSPPSTSPPATFTAPPALPKSQAVSVLPASSPPAISPTTKSPPAMTASPSMNLQEAIRLRTAARSKAGPPSRLSMHPPTSPTDLHKSPSSTASFIFAKSNKRVVIETKPVLETTAAVHKKLEVSSVTKAVGEAESVKKVPPPVARKPKTKSKEIETSEGTEQTAGQEALQESVKDAAEKTNGTAGTVEGGTPST